MTTVSSNNTVRHAARLLLMLFGAVALGLEFPQPAAAAARPAPAAAAALRTRALRKNAAPVRAIMLVQGDDDASSSPGASPEQIEKYVAVYRAMQRDHSLTVEQASAAQGFTVAAFRELEQRIERDDLSRDSARRALAEPTPSQAATAAPAPKARR